MRNERWVMLWVGLALAVPACGASEDEQTEDLGEVTDGKGDVPAIDKEVVLGPRLASGKPFRRTFSVTSDGDFVVDLSYGGDAVTRLDIMNMDDGTKVATEFMVQPNLLVEVSGGNHFFKLRVENDSDLEIVTRLRVHPRDEVAPDLEAAAEANLRHISAEIDVNHLDNYGLSGSPEKRFLAALEVEYAAAEPDQYQARMVALASMIFFAAPEIQPPAGGKLTPFHGLDMDQFDALMEIEDFVFDNLMDEAGGVEGVRPFSVCETRFMIETFVRPRAALPQDFAGYRSDYAAFAESCPQKDLDEWYNFRGLGGLRPSWVESNIQDRFLRRMAKKCQNPTGEWKGECAQWNADRMGYRQDGNRQLAARVMFYDPAEQEDYLAETSNDLVLLEDRNGDGVGEMLRPGPVTLTNGQHGELVVESTGEFSGELKLVTDDGAEMSVRPRDLVAEDSVHPDFDAGLLGQKDWGLMALFSDSTGCTGDVLSDSECPLLKRFFTLIDRHEDFYQTYTALNPDFQGISSQPSPLVACSITLEAAHAWDSAGTPEGGEAGFIFLMRIPFEQILTGSRRNFATLSPGPKVTTIQDLYSGAAELDMDKVWVDIATLSNNQFSSEHEISKVGAVPADQIEGILVIRRPAAMQ